MYSLGGGPGDEPGDEPGGAPGGAAGAVSVPAGGALRTGEGPTAERILNAAEDCMSRMGMRRVAMADVARRAGLSRGALYLHFADRAALLDAVLARTASRFVANSRLPVQRRRTLAAQVAEAAVFIRQHLGDALLTLRLPGEDESLLAVLMTVQSERLVREWVAFWLPFLHDAEARGEIRHGLDHRHCGEWIVRMLLSFAVLAAVTFDPDDPRAVRAFVAQHVVAGLAPAA
jgi:AcrR family transcriptional regulator